MLHPGHMIQSRQGLVELVSELEGRGTLGLDVEGDGLYRYRSRLCTLQIGDADGVAVIDALAIDDLSPLAPLLDSGGPRKVVHDVSFDRKMLATRDLPLGGVFDTSVAARFLGETSTGLASLLEARFGVKLNKKFQKADWGERPIDDERLAYLVADVRHLPALAAQFEEQASALDLLEEIEEEARYAMDRALDPEVVRAPWTRIKGVRELRGEGLAVLRALADAREAEAEEADVPPFRIASNRVLFEAARRRPKRLKDLRRIRGLSKMPDDRLERALKAARRDGPPTTDHSDPAPPSEERAERKLREKALSKWRKAEADARGVVEQAVLPGHCLRDLARLSDLSEAGVASVRGLGDKRARRYGPDWIALLIAADASG